MAIWDSIIGDDKTEKPQGHPQVQAINTEEHRQSDGGFNLNTLKNVLDGVDERKTEQEHREQRQETKREETSWVDKITDVLDGGKRREEEERERARVQEEERRKAEEAEKDKGWTHKLLNVLDGPDDPAAKVAASEQLHTQAQSGTGGYRAAWLSKIKDILDGEDVEQLGKGGKTEAQNAQHNDWRQKIQDAINGGPAPEEKKGFNLGDKLNQFAGGGKQGEINEDALDKAIDLVQKHFLGAGDQSNESAVEQLKDEQISDGIRMAYKTISGHELPIKDKGH